MLKVDLHTHTVASKHAFNTIQEMAEEAARRGVEILGIADHGPAAGDGASRDYFLTGTRRLPRTICGVKILFGIEANIINAEGEVDINDSVLEELDFVIASLHKPVSSDQSINTGAIIKAMKNPNIKIIGHPYSTSNGLDIDIIRVAEAAVSEDILLEINSSYFFHRKLESEMEAFYDKIRTMAEILKKNNKQMIINSDAHHSSEIGRDEAVKEKFDYLDLSENDIINYDLAEVKKYFQIN